MSSPLAGSSEELAGRQVGQAAPSPVLPDGPRHPHIVQAWLWLKKPTWFLDHCSRAYGEVFTMRLPLGMNLVHIAGPELLKAVFSGNSDVLRAGEANAAILEPGRSGSSGRRLRASGGFPSEAASGGAWVPRSPPLRCAQSFPRCCAP